MTRRTNERIKYLEDELDALRFRVAVNEIELAEIKEAGLRWIKAMDDDSDAYIYIEHCGEILDDLEAIFRRVLERV